MLSMGFCHLTTGASRGTGVCVTVSQRARRKRSGLVLAKEAPSRSHECKGAGRKTGKNIFRG